MLFEGDRFAAPPIAIAFLSFCVAMAIGGIWEIFEFSMDQFFGMNMQKSGLVDTMWDLIVDALGTLFAAVTGFLYLKTPRDSGLGHGQGHVSPTLALQVDAAIDGNAVEPG